MEKDLKNEISGAPEWALRNFFSWCHDRYSALSVLENVFHLFSRTDKALAFGGAGKRMVGCGMSIRMVHRRIFCCHAARFPCACAIVPSELPSLGPLAPSRSTVPPVFRWWAPSLTRPSPPKPGAGFGRVHHRVPKRFRRLEEGQRYRRPGVGEPHVCHGM